MGPQSAGWRTAHVLKWSLWVGVVMLVSSLSRAGAAGVEYRTFSITIDGKPAGEYQMTLTRQGHGSVAVNCQADVRFKVALIYTYTYSYQGTETWKDGRLMRLDSSSNDDGKRFTVSAQADGKDLRVTVNDEARTVRGDVWTTSCWHLPDAKFRNADLPLLDADTARELSGTMQYVGTDRVNVAGEMRDCTHYRVTGDVQYELWYDRRQRLVRQENVEDGRRIVLELTGLR